VAAASTTASAAFTQRISHALHVICTVPIAVGIVHRRRRRRRRPRQNVRGGGWRVAGQQAAQAQAPEHGGRGRANPPTVSAPVPAAPTTVCARVRGTPAARLVVADAVHANVAVRTGPVVGPV